MNFLKTSIALCLVVFSFNASAYTIQNVGEFYGYTYNEFLKKNIKQKATVWVGITEKGEEIVTVRFHTGLKDIDMSLNRQSKQYEYFVNSINKTVEWHEIAKSNSVDITKQFDKIKGEGCSTWSSWCSISFEAFSNGQNAVMWMHLEDTDNQFYTFSGQLNMNNITLLKEILDTQVEIGLEARRVALNDDPADKEALFN